MTTFKTKTLQNGDVSVEHTYFAMDDYVTDVAVYQASGHYVHRINPNGTLTQVCEGLLPRGPTLHCGDDLEAAIRRTLKLKKNSGDFHEIN